METKRWAFVFLSIVMGNVVIGQKTKFADTLAYEHFVFQKGIDLKSGISNKRECGKAYLFLNSTGDSLVLNQFGTRLYRNIAILGLSNSCICIGDTVSIELHTIDQKGLDSDFAMFNWLQRWGRLKRDGQFAPPLRYRGWFLIRNSWLEWIVIVRNRAYFVEVPGHKKYYSRHGDAGDNCGSCKE